MNKWTYTVKLRRGYDDPMYFEFSNFKEAQTCAQFAVGAHVVDTYGDGEIKKFEVSMHFNINADETTESEDDF